MARAVLTRAVRVIIDLRFAHGEYRNRGGVRHDDTTKTVTSCACCRYLASAWRGWTRRAGIVYERYRGHAKELARVACQGLQISCTVRAAQALQRRVAQAFGRRAISDFARRGDR